MLALNPKGAGQIHFSVLFNALCVCVSSVRHISPNLENADRPPSIKNNYCNSGSFFKCDVHNCMCNDVQLGTSETLLWQL